MKFLSTMTLVLFSFVGIASAADMPLKARAVAAPVDPWTGFYVGANIGYGAGSSSVTTQNTCLAAGCGGAGTAFSSNLADNSVSGINGGLQLGYNWMLNPAWLAGFETDFQFADQSGQAVSNTAGPVAFAANQSLNWFGTVRGRAGFAFNNILFFGTGGLAFGELRATTFGLSESHTNAGWTLGAGAEMGFAPNWSAKIEYLYVDLANSNFVVTGASNGYRFGLIRAGVNYRF